MTWKRVALPRTSWFVAHVALMQACYMWLADVCSCRPPNFCQMLILFAQCSEVSFHQTAVLQPFQCVVWTLSTN
jgi:hypothetical protein